MPIGYPQPDPVHTLPDQPDLEHLKNQAKQFQRQVRGGDQGASAQAAQLDPSTRPGPDYPLSSAQLVTARSYGFASWPRLRAHVELIRQLSRFPEPAPEAPDAEQSAERLLQLATLNYTQDADTAIAEGSRLLDRHPELATADVYTMAATGAAEELATLLAEHPEQVHAEGGPFGWVPLLYLSYSRLDERPGRSAVAAARVLLEAGADPNAGYLWHGLRSPFTALTGVFGGGEQNQPIHRQATELARLLLEAGADPNDNQALYNRMFRPNNDHLRLLFEYGLGTEVDSPWRRGLGDHYPTPEQMITEQLRWAADHGMTDRVRLLLDHGVDANGQGYHPNYAGTTPYQLAILGGNLEIAALLEAAGADTSSIDPVDELLGAATAGDRVEVERRTAAEPELLDRARERRPGAVRKATEAGRADAVELLIELGFEKNQPGEGEYTALHQAALDGRDDLVDLLLDHGADPTVVESRFQAQPSGWAAHSGHHALAERLRAAATDR